MAMQARPQVFINHGENNLSDGFIRHVTRALSDQGFNVYIGSDERRKRGMEHIVRAIDNSNVALVIFSDRYAASELCLHEAVRIYDQRREGTLVLIPVFYIYKVSTNDVNMFNGSFGEGFLETLKIQGTSHPFAEHWMRNVNFICTDTGFVSENYSNDTDLVEEIVRGVKKRLQGKKLTRRVQAEDLQSYLDMSMPKQPKAQEGFGKELLYVSIAALFCYFMIPLIWFSMIWMSSVSVNGS